MVLELYPAGLTGLEMGLDDGPLPVIDGIQGVGAEELLDLLMALIVTQSQLRPVLEARPRGGGGPSESGS